MPSKIQEILTDLNHNWIQDKPNKYIIYGDVWVQEINNKLNEVNIQYKWCYEKGNLTYYITQE